MFSGPLPGWPLRCVERGVDGKKHRRRWRGKTFSLYKLHPHVNAPTTYPQPAHSIFTTSLTCKIVYCETHCLNLSRQPIGTCLSLSNRQSTSKSQTLPPQRATAKMAGQPPCRIVVMASGNGSNFQALIDAVADNTIPNSVITRLFVNRAKAYATTRADKAGRKSLPLSAFSLCLVSSTNLSARHPLGVLQSHKWRLPPQGRKGPREGRRRA